MAFPLTPILDDFNRSNTGPPPSSSWSGPVFSGDGQLKVVSNQLSVNASGFSDNYWNTLVGPDCEVYATIVTIAGSGTPTFYLDARITSPNAAGVSGYELDWAETTGATDSLFLYRFDSGVYTQLGASVSQEVASGDSLGMSVIGSTITGYYKSGAGAWTSFGARTDSTYTGIGYISIGSDNTTHKFDNFGGGTIGSSPPQPQVRLPMAILAR